jgi:SAM-dependent methyltransferase
MSKRLEYQKMFVDGNGKIVNLGCGDIPVDFGPNTVQVDFDNYNYPNFVKADIHNLPFKDDEFDTAVLGDVLEHCYDPVKALSEAGRVAKKVVATVFEEWRLVPGGYEEQNKKKMQDLEAMGFDTEDAYYRSLPVFKDHIITVEPDDKVPHHCHLHEFTDAGLRDIIKKAELQIKVFHKYIDGAVGDRPYYNWLLVLHKPNK